MYDVIIVGAGPAGSQAAKNLATQNKSVLLLDKAKFPRVKPCGGGLTPHVWRRHPELLNFAENLNYAGKIFPDESDIPIYYERDEIIGAYCVRSIFDELLVKEAIKVGAEFKDDKKVNNISVQNDKVIITTDEETFESKLVLAADGYNSIIAKRMNLGTKFSLSKFAFCYDIEEEFPEEVIKEYFGEKYVTYWHSGFLNTPGYAYIFPKRRHINIGYGTTIPAEGLNLNYRELLLKYITHCEEKGYIPKFSKKHIKGGMYPVCGPHKNIVSDRVILLGDAAGFVNPLSGEGIHYAIYSADIAAEVLKNAFEKENFSKEILQSYYNICMKEFGNYLKKCVGLQYTLNRGNKVISKFGRDVPNVTKHLKELLDEKNNPRIVIIKMSFWIGWGILKSLFRRGKKKKS